MKYLIRAVLLIVAFFCIVPSVAWCQANWEAKINVSSAHVESRLAIGQRDDATDRRDGRYDVPPMLSGSLQARLLGSGTPLWRDIRSPEIKGGQEWRLVIANNSGKPVTVSWNSAEMPEGVEMVLFDPAEGVTVDMKKTDGYTLGDPAGGEILIRLIF